MCIRDSSRLTEEIGNNFEWANLNINYAKTLKDLQHFINEFQTRSIGSNDERGIALAKYILAPGRIKLWLSDLDKLFKGSDGIIQHHQPLMIAYINKYRTNACSNSYKTRIDHAYQQFSVLQQQAYIMWAEALFILEKKTSGVSILYEKRLKEQV